MEKTNEQITLTEKDIEQFGKQCANIFEQVSRDVIGQKEVVEGYPFVGNFIQFAKREYLEPTAVR